MNWESLDWEVLDRLRESFLSGTAANGPYWHTITDLEYYNFTYGERIGWKWDAVLAELRLRGWTPCGEPGRTAPAGTTVLDWGCGSGIAGRRVVDFFGVANFTQLLLHDHSALAMDFAEHHGRKIFPTITVARAGQTFIESSEPIGILVISHVLNELDEAARTELRALAARAETILWVEPGTHEVSRTLGGWRERLRGKFRAIAPCPHQATCGVLAPGNERHWCHFFAAPPAGVYADSGWVKFGQRAGIDLRSLPYSFLVLDQRSSALSEEQGVSRILGEPRHYKGYAKIFNCDETGVSELMLQKRDAPEIFKALKDPDGPMIYRWTRNGDRITSAEPGFGP